MNDSQPTRSHRSLLGAALLVVASGAIAAVAPAPVATAATDPTGFHGVTPTRILDTRDGTGAPAGPLGPDATIDLDVAGVAGVPDTGVKAVVLNVTATEGTANSFVTVFPSGEDRPTASNLNFTPGASVPNLVIAKVGSGGAVSLFNRFGSVHLIADVSGYFDDAAQLTPLNPSRIVDTRSGLGGTVGPVSGSTTVQVSGQGGVPAAGATAVVLNVTASDPTAAGFITVYPQLPVPTASNLNLTPGVTRPNLVIARLDHRGQLRYRASVSTHVIIDVMAYIDSPPLLTDLLNPVGSSNGGDEATAVVGGVAYEHSIVDETLAGSNEAVAYKPAGAWAALETTLAIDDRAPDGARVQLRILGGALGTPIGSETVLVEETLTKGETLPVAVDISSYDRILFAATGDSPGFGELFPAFLDPMLSVLPEVPDQVHYHAFSPQRLLDTRNGTGVSAGILSPGTVLSLNVLGAGNLPTSGIAAVAVNLTVTGTAGPGYVTVYPSGSAAPRTSNVNYSSVGETTPNFAIVPVGADGRINLAVSVSATHVIADVAGWFAGEPTG